MDKKKVVLGMSGGVDSSVAAYLLKEQGYDVIGVTMQIWQDKNPDAVEVEGGCCSLSAVDDARMVAEKLEIPFYVMNFKEVFKDTVIDYFIDEYKKGRTPNPCIACNRHVKFEEFMRRAFALDAYYLSTGHYAIIERDETTGRYLLKKSNASEKDQTYALYNMTQEQLKHTLMPLGEYKSKDEIRAIAEKLGLVVSNKPDSQEICFVPDNDYGKFIAENSDHRDIPGDFVDMAGKVVGNHTGISNYTIGQRKGLGLALGYPAYVVDIDPVKNVVTVGQNEDVFGKSLLADDLNLISIESLDGPIDIEAKVRYSAKESPAKLIPLDGGTVRVEFDKPVRAITPGQSVVFYDGDVVVGGATIIRKED